jgi:hypothetical protein
MLTIDLTSDEVRDLEVNPRSGKSVNEDARPLRRVRPLCAGCRRRHALTRVRGRYVVLADHDLCRQCWRALVGAGNATRAARRAKPGRSR